MPIGNDCEYADFDDCVRKNQGADDPEALCGALQRDTEDKCSSALTASVRVPSPSVEALDRVADRYERLVDRQMAGVADLAARRVRRAPSAAAASDKDLNVVFEAWRTAVDEELLPALEEAWLEAANGQLDAAREALPLLAAVSLTGEEAPSVPPPFAAGDVASTAYLKAAANRLVGIGDVLWDAARTEMVAGMFAGESVPSLARRVSAAAGVAKPRATVIARTEAIRASNAGSITSMRSLPEQLVATKEWLATGDARTRPTHADADGQAVPLNDLFSVGMDSLDFPGDPNGSPEETINCRCTMTYGLDSGPLVAADVTDTTGMIALRPADPGGLAIDGGDPPEDLHVTLVFLGDEVAPVLRDEAARVAEQVAEDWAPFTVRIAGYGTLGDEDAFVVFLNGGGLGGPHAHCALGMMGAEGMPDQHEPWIPHLTLGYGVTPDDPDELIGREFGIDAVSVDVGDRHERFPLRGEPVTASDTPTGAGRFAPGPGAATVPATGLASRRGGAHMAVDDQQAQQRAGWHGVLVVEGVPTGDGREFAKKSLTWPEMPIHLQWQKETTHGGINDVVVSVGTVEKIVRKGNEIRGEGFIDLGSEDGAELHRRMSQAGHPGGVSIVADDPEHADVEYRFPAGCDDLMKDDTPIDDVPIEDLMKCMEPEVVVFHSGRVRAVTVVDTQAFVEAKIELDEEAAVAAAVTLPVTLTVGETTTEIGHAHSPQDVPEILSAWAAALREVQEEEATGEAFVSEEKWDGSPSRFTDEQYQRAAAVCEGDAPPKQSCHLPHHEPGGAVSRAGVHAASAGRGVSRLKGVSADGIASAKAHLRGHYTKDLDEEPPDSLKAEAEDAEETAVETPQTAEAAEPEAPPEAEVPEALVAAAYTVTIPDVPPVDWYLEPSELPAIGAITVTPEGRLFGLLAPRGIGHRSFAERRVEVPTGNVDYARFMNRPTRVTLADGTVEEVPAGVVTMDCGHAKPVSSVDTGKALEHYCNSCSIVATVRVGENRHGVWVAGALMPGIEANDLARLLACQLSGDWRPHPEQPGMRELAGALLVPVPGFATAGPTVRLDQGELVAAAAPVQFSATGDFAVPVFGVGRDDDHEEAGPGEPADTGFVEDLPDFETVMASNDPRARAAAMAKELGLDLPSRLAELVASVRGDEA